MLKVEVIGDLGRLRQIATDWIHLAERASSTTPFQLPDWQLTWWQHFGSGQLRVFTFWRERSLVGIIPLFRHEWNGRRQLTILGSGISDYLEPLIDDPEVLQHFAAALRDDADWDVCNWQDLSATTPLQRLPGFHTQVVVDTPCSAIPLEGSFDEYWALRSADLRRNIKRYARKAETDAPLVFSVEQPPDPASLAALIRLHGERWQRQGEAGMVEVNSSGNFLREVTCIDTCRLFALQWKHSIVAATVGFVRGNTLYSYLSAFNPQYEILGFGRYLLYQSLRWAFTNRFQRWDFMRGSESYKASWGAVETQKSRVVIERG